MTIFVCFMFSGGMPLMVPISFVGLLTRYLYFKSSFIRFCRVPKTFDDSINNRVMKMLPVCVIVNLMMCIWMYGVSEIFPF